MPKRERAWVDKMLAAYLDAKKAARERERPTTEDRLLAQPEMTTHHSFQVEVLVRTYSPVSPSSAKSNLRFNSRAKIPRATSSLAA